MNIAPLHPNFIKDSIFCIYLFDLRLSMKILPLSFSGERTHSMPLGKLHSVWF